MAPGFQAFMNYFIEIIYRIKIDVIQLTDLGFNVPWNRDIHHEDGAVFAPFQRPLNQALA